MDLFAQERDRLLRTTTRFLGISATVVSLVALSYPGVTDVRRQAAIVFFSLVMIAFFIMIGRSGKMLWVVLGMAAGLIAGGIALVPGGIDGPLATAVIPLVGGAIASFALLLSSSTKRVLLAAAAAVVVVAEVVIGTQSVFSVQVAAVLLGWVLCFVAGFWIGNSVPRAARRIYSIGNAHRAERQASETEAQRRQGARLLHDTVLATLTLLAHSGFGVTPDALRAQAAEDARLLRHLRLGSTPQPQASGDYNLDTVEESPLGQTLESVKQRFGRMGLEVSWHGTGQVLLPTNVLDAFLLALAECLENVRRHAGVVEAHVTIIHDDKMVRAMVTDAGVGFELEGVSEERLGFKESVVNRLREVGGSARLFSAPGAGTTVVLEAPR
ncbi:MULTISPECIES: sensor histidine kinase [unclassified Frondihabitans]|uniref:sensor histidine kinase n=1 Tax=unclassified Frondihabitans TaxID=2626248 RepID=UPI000F4DB424|nr:MULTISPECIES: ATP-binding protein [unclassified Frondihabitans]RPE74486.1 signal transduction histidine kinase [Frondihabitans sp. PhB153]RPF02915.1 signal transduction histidine kinase [Frondihabitans sp. PhB161]